MIVHSLHHHLRARHEPDPDAGRQHFGDAVEPEHPPHRGLGALEREVGGRARGGAVVEGEVGVIWTCNIDVRLEG